MWSIVHRSISSLSIGILFCIVLIVSSSVRQSSDIGQRTDRYNFGPNEIHNGHSHNVCYSHRGPSFLSSNHAITTYASFNVIITVGIITIAGNTMWSTISSNYSTLARSTVVTLPIVIWMHDTFVSFCRVQGSSMEPTLQHGDIVLVRKSDFYGWHSITKTTVAAAAVAPPPGAPKTSRTRTNNGNHTSTTSSSSSPTTTTTTAVAAEAADTQPPSSPEHDARNAADLKLQHHQNQERIFFTKFRSTTLS
jgi:hypothetical protein